MEKRMDRRQRKTREAIFNAFCDLLSKKHYNRITVGEIIEAADVGRATFYAHFETKDLLLKALCEELFCHVFDSTEQGERDHKHIFECDAPKSVFLHLLQHLQKNDRNILTLLTCESNSLFLQHFKENLKDLIQKQLPLFSESKPKDIPDDFWINHVASSFVEAVKWWIENGRKESPQALASCFNAVL